MCFVPVEPARARCRKPSEKVEARDRQPMAGTRGDPQRPTSPHNHPQPPLGAPCTGSGPLLPPNRSHAPPFGRNGGPGISHHPPKPPRVAEVPVLHRPWPCRCVESATPHPPWPLCPTRKPPFFPPCPGPSRACSGDLIACLPSPITSHHDSHLTTRPRTTGRHFGLVLTIFLPAGPQTGRDLLAFCFARSRLSPRSRGNNGRATIHVHDGNDGCLGGRGAPPADLFIPYTYKTPLSPSPACCPTGSACNTTHCISCTSNCAAGRLPFIPPLPPHTPPCIAPPTLLLPEPRLHRPSDAIAAPRSRPPTAAAAAFAHDSLHDSHLIASLARPPLSRSFASDAQRWY